MSFTSMRRLLLTSCASIQSSHNYLIQGGPNCNGNNDSNSRQTWQGGCMAFTPVITPHTQCSSSRICSFVDHIAGVSQISDACCVLLSQSCSEQRLYRAGKLTGRTRFMCKNLHLNKQPILCGGITLTMRGHNTHDRGA